MTDTAHTPDHSDLPEVDRTSGGDARRSPRTTSPRR